MQLMSLLRDYDVDWPGSTIQLLSYSDSLNLGISITAPQCFVPGYNFFVFYIATMAQPASSCERPCHVLCFLPPMHLDSDSFFHSCGCIPSQDVSVTAYDCVILTGYQSTSRPFDSAVERSMQGWS